MSASELQTLVAGALSSRVIAIKIGNDRLWRCRVEIAVEGALVGSRGIARATVVVRIDAPATAEQPPMQANGVLERSFDAAQTHNRQAELRELLRRGLPDLLKPVHRESELRTGSVKNLEVALHDSDAAVRKIAVRTCALRRETTVVPSLIERLRDSDTEVVDAAIGALAALGDARAVRPLCDLVPMRDAAALAKVLDAIATLGGQEALAYLDFVATGHEDAEVRQLAKEALGRLQRRGLGAGK